MYMGEIVRLIILDLWEKELLFVGHRDHNWSTDYRQALYTKGSFYTKYVSEIETDSGVTFRFNFLSMKNSFLTRTFGFIFYRKHFTFKAYESGVGTDGLRQANLRRLRNCAVCMQAGVTSRCSTSRRW